MEDRREERHLSRLVLNIKQALNVAQVLRGEQGLFGSHPFSALGVGALLASVTARMEPEFIKQRDWPDKLFPRLEQSPSYAPIVSRELGTVLETAYLEHNIDRTRKAMAEVEEWGHRVAGGDTSASYLSKTAESVGLALLNCFVKERRGEELPRSMIGKRAAQLFEMGMTVNGRSFDDAVERDRFHVRKLALIELVVMSTTTHMFLLGDISYDEIGRWELVEPLLPQTTYAETYFAKSVRLMKMNGPMVFPTVIARVVREAWSQKLSQELQLTLEWLDAYCEGMERSYEAAVAPSSSAAPEAFET